MEDLVHEIEIRRAKRAIEKHKTLENRPRDRKPKSEIICYNRWGVKGTE